MSERWREQLQSDHDTAKAVLESRLKRLQQAITGTLGRLGEGGPLNIYLLENAPAITCEIQAYNMTLGYLTSLGAK